MAVAAVKELDDLIANPIDLIDIDSTASDSVGIAESSTVTGPPFICKDNVFDTNVDTDTNRSVKKLTQATWDTCGGTGVGRSRSPPP